jgi:hypothetical protein
MIAFNKFRQEPLPMVFFKNITSSENKICGDCTNCGETNVSLLEHVCENPNISMDQLVQKITNLEPQSVIPKPPEYLSAEFIRALLMACVTLILVLVWRFLYV